MTIDELIQTAHKQAVDAGFWDSERNIGEVLMLCISECGEALEAHRNGRFCTSEDLEESFWRSSTKRGPSGTIYVVNDTMFKDGFKNHIKDTFEDELADIVIRIADLCGAKNLSINAEAFDGVWTERSVPEQLFLLVGYLYNARMPDGEVGEFNLSGAVSLTFWIAKSHNIDLLRHVELKLAYNRTRGVRHGKAY